MAVSAADVKRLREETDAPMMECKAALDEADGDFEKAKTILREKGKAAAAKRQDRATSEGIAMFVLSPDAKTAGGVVVECETDFVARNEDFIATAKELAGTFIANDPGSDPLAVTVNGKTVGAIVEESVAKIRENIQLKKAVQLSGPVVAVYVHHDRKKAVAVSLEGDATNIAEVGKHLAIQAVAFPPTFLFKDEVPKDAVAKELEVETHRAINEGKSEQVAQNIAQGRVNKEFFKRVVLMEQEFYVDTKKSVAQYVAEAAKAGGGSIKLLSLVRLAVGEA